MSILVGRVPVRAPFPWPQLLAYLSHRLTPQLERIEAHCYVRQVGQHAVTVSYVARRGELKITASGRVRTQEVLRNLSRLMDVNHDAEAVRAHLNRSALLKPRLAKVPGMRPLGAWSPFELCVRTIVGQQVTVAAAGTLMSRLVQRCNGLSPHSVVEADLTSIGMPGRRVQAVRTFAQAVLDGQVNLDRPWLQVEAALARLPGFGPWTRGYLAIRLGRDPDAFPATDLGLIRAAQVESAAELSALADAWRPYRAYAATYLWAVA